MRKSPNDFIEASTVNDHTELKKAAEAAKVADYPVPEAYEEDRRYSDSELAYLAFAKLATPAAVLGLIDELQAAKIDQEIAQFARDTTVIPGLGDALDPIIDQVIGHVNEPATAEEWYATMKSMLDAAKASGLWPVPAEPELTDEAQADRDEFVSMSDERGCSCNINPPCGYCTHPGNPMNQEDPSCWKVAP